MQNKKNIKTLDIVLIVVGISTFVFTTVMFIFFALFQEIPDTLCERFFTCIIGECGITGLIQVAKTFCNYKTNKNTNLEEYPSDEYQNDLELSEGDDLNE